MDECFRWQVDCVGYRKYLRSVIPWVQMWATPSVLKQQRVQCIDGTGKSRVFIFIKETDPQRLSKGIGLKKKPRGKETK